MRRYLPHRTSLVVVVAMLVGTSLAFGTAQRVVHADEERLLEDRAGDVAGLLESLGTSFEARMASVAAVAQVTAGDIEQFRIAVLAADDDVGTSDQGGWALLRRTPGGYEEVTTLGSPTPARKLPAAWADGLDRAASGQFALLGFMGEGLERRFGMATGRAGVPGDLVVYSEAPLAGATTGATTDSSLIGGLAVAVYVGTEPDPDQVVLAFGELRGAVEEVVVDIAGTKVLLQVSATDRLTGSLATNFPRILLGAGLLLALALASLVEITLRRRDDALTTVSELEQKNLQLDRAFAEQRTAEEARAALEADLQQAHRLEALGHLAGGVAHDFNNLLAAILSYAELVEDTVRDPQATEDLEQIRGAARRGASLTRQLLQFSRHAPVEPALVDVNDQVRELTTLLVRTLGEDVNLRTALAADPATVLADAHELDQVLLNLVVNARDAVDAGGSIAIETSRIVLDSAAAQQHPNLSPGPHVRVVVRDDGCGMEPEVGRARLRAVLHHQGTRPGHRAGSRDGVRDRPAPRGQHLAHLHAWPRHGDGGADPRGRASR